MSAYNAGHRPDLQGAVEVVVPSELYTRGDRTRFLFLLFLVGSLNYADRNVIGVLLEQIKTEFQVSDTMLGLLSGISFALFYATLGIPVARWADRGDRKRVITWSLSIWSLMTALCGLTSSFWQLVAARFGVGAGEAGAIPPAQSLIADYYPPAQRARAIGIFMMSSSAGYALGLILGGLIAQLYGWRAAFIFFGALGFVLAPLTRHYLEEPRRVLPRLVLQPQNSESFVEAMRALMLKPAYRNLLGAIVLYFFMAYGAFVFIVSLLTRVHGLNVAQAGGIFGAISAVGAVIGMLGGGALADRFAARNLVWLSRVAGGAMLAAIPLYELAFSSANLSKMIHWLLLAATAHAAVVPPAFSAIHVICGSQRRALSVAVVFFFANLLGFGLGPVITGALSDHLGAIYGTGEGLRYALMAVMLVLLPASWLMLRTARYLARDAEA